MSGVFETVIKTCAALLIVAAIPGFAMGSDPERLRLTYQAEAYRAWPVVFGLNFNGVQNVAPETTRCCIADNAAPGDGSGSGITVLYEGKRPDLELDVIWAEVHSNHTFRARLSVPLDEIEGWTGGDVPVVLSFRPGGELVLYVDGPELAATRPGADISITSGQDMADLLTAPGLGRRHTRADYVEIRRVCGTIDADPPKLFASGRDHFAPSVMAKIESDRALPLPDPNCKVDP